MPVNTSITLRKGSSYQWESTNPVLASGEPGYDITNNILKIGDGINNYNNLPILFSGTYASGIHNHISSDITDFNSSVSGILPITDIVAGSNISIVPSGSIYTVSVSGSLGLTTEEVDDRVADLLVAGSGITLDYNDELNTLTINSTGGGSGSVNDIIAGSGIVVSSSGGDFTISALENIINSSNLYLWANFR